jgi:hypothetical protein
MVRRWSLTAHFLILKYPPIAALAGQAHLGADGCHASASAGRGTRHGRVLRGDGGGAHPPAGKSALRHRHVADHARGGRLLEAGTYDAFQRREPRLMYKRVSLDASYLSTTDFGRAGTVRLNLRELGLTRVGSCAAVTQWMSLVGRGLDELGSCAYIASSSGAYGVHCDLGYRGGGTGRARGS